MSGARQIPPRYVCSDQLRLPRRFTTCPSPLAARTPVRFRSSRRLFASVGHLTRWPGAFTPSAPFPTRRRFQRRYFVERGRFVFCNEHLGGAFRSRQRSARSSPFRPRPLLLSSRREVAVAAVQASRVELELICLRRYFSVDAPAAAAADRPIMTGQRRGRANTKIAGISLRFTLPTVVLSIIEVVQGSCAHHPTRRVSNLQTTTGRVLAVGAGSCRLVDAVTRARILPMGGTALTGGVRARPISCPAGTAAAGRGAQGLSSRPAPGEGDPPSVYHPLQVVFTERFVHQHLVLFPEDLLAHPVQVAAHFLAFADHIAQVSQLQKAGARMSNLHRGGTMAQGRQSLSLPIRF